MNFKHVFLNISLLAYCNLRTAVVKHSANFGEKLRALEVHYMRDRDRGVVWEEVLILLPDTVRGRQGPKRSQIRASES